MTGKLIAAAILACAPVTGLAQEAVEYDMTAYLWVPTTDTDVATRWGTASTEVSGKDALEALDFGLMLNGSARSGKWNLMGDIIYLDLSADTETPFGALFSKLTTVTKLSSASLYALYSVYEAPVGRFELGGGLRAMSVDLDLTLVSGLLGQRKLGVTDSWVDPVLAAKFTRNFNETWYGTVFLDYGGFGGGSTSEESWQAVATIGYRMNENWTILGSYRHLQLDRSTNGHDYQLRLSGPVLGVNYRF